MPPAELSSTVAGLASTFNFALLIPLMGVIFTFTVPVVVLLIVVRSKAARTRMLHETVLKLAEKGQPIPPELFQDKPRKSEEAKKTSPLRNGVMFVAFGLGTAIMFPLLSGNYHTAGLGIIPLLMGIGYLIIWNLEKRDEK